MVIPDFALPFGDQDIFSLCIFQNSTPYLAFTFHTLARLFGGGTFAVVKGAADVIQWNVGIAVVIFEKPVMQLMKEITKAWILATCHQYYLKPTIRAIAPNAYRFTCNII